MQHGAVGLVADRTQHRALLRAGLAQHGQRLVGVGGDDHGVKAFGAVVGDDAHTGLVALDQAHGGVQPCIGQAGDDLLDICFCPTEHAAPLRPVGHLDEPVVVTEADHGRHRELQHLIGRAAPDAAEHGQEVPVAEGVAKVVLAQKIGQRLAHLRLTVVTGDARAQRVEAQHIGQHAPELRVDQIALLCKHAGQVGTAPFERLSVHGAGHLGRKRHVARHALDLQLRKQIDQVGIGALVEDQKAGVHAVGDRALRCRQRDVHRVGVAAEVVARLVQGQLGLALQGVGGRKAGNAGADDGDSGVLHQGAFNCFSMAATRLRLSGPVMLL